MDIQGVKRLLYDERNTRGDRRKESALGAQGIKAKVKSGDMLYIVLCIFFFSLGSVERRGNTQTISGERHMSEVYGEWAKLGARSGLLTCHVRYIEDTQLGFGVG